MFDSKGTVLITGANGAIGCGFVSQFLKTPEAATHTGLYVVRNPDAAVNLKAILKSAPPTHDYRVFAIDQSRLANVREAAADINKQVADGNLPPIRAVILNAGAQDTASQVFTEDGFDSMFAINYLANFSLVLLLLQSMDTERGRIISLGSTAHNPAFRMNHSLFPLGEKTILFSDPETLGKGKDDFKKGQEFIAGMRRYAKSRLLLIMFTYELQRRLDADPNLSNISVLNVDPAGVPNSSLAKDASLSFRMFLKFLVVVQMVISAVTSNGPLRSPTDVGKSLVFAVFDEKTIGVHPKALYLDGTTISDSSVESHDESKQKQLWEASLGFSGISEGDTVLQDWK